MESLPAGVVFAAQLDEKSQTLFIYYENENIIDLKQSNWHLVPHPFRIREKILDPATLTKSKLHSQMSRKDLGLQMPVCKRCQKEEQKVIASVAEEKKKGKKGAKNTTWFLENFCGHWVAKKLPTPESEFFLISKVCSIGSNFSRCTSRNVEQYHPSDDFVKSFDKDTRADVPYNLYVPMIGSPPFENLVEWPRVWAYRNALVHFAKIAVLPEKKLMAKLQRDKNFFKQHSVFEILRNNVLLQKFVQKMHHIFKVDVDLRNSLPNHRISKTRIFFNSRGLLFVSQKCKIFYQLDLNWKWPSREGLEKDWKSQGVYSDMIYNATESGAKLLTIPQPTLDEEDATVDDERCATVFLLHYWILHLMPSLTVMFTFWNNVKQMMIFQQIEEKASEDEVDEDARESGITEGIEYADHVDHGRLFVLAAMFDR